MTHLSVGDRVGLGWHAGYCMVCDECLGWHHNLCADAAPTIAGRHGGFADTVRAKSAKAWGCRVTAFTSESKQREAIELGAHDTIDSRDPEAIEAAGGRFDLVLSTVNVPLDWNAVLATLKPRGRLHMLGAVTEPLGVNLLPDMMSKQLSVGSSPVGSPVTIRRMLEFAARHDVTPDRARSGGGVAAKRGSHGSRRASRPAPGLDYVPSRCANPGRLVALLLLDDLRVAAAPVSVLEQPLVELSGG